CADSTGHGVPGGFMSVMGTTLIKDICYRSDLESPSEMLALLDHEIHRRLNQNIEAERSNDGMDLILCDINLETYVVRIASAMRPVILYVNGEQMYIPGSRNSVGGTIISHEDKVFEDRVYAMSKGDLIYMFSDGYTDQFGGPLGKKFKIARLRNLLKDIHQKPMTEQYQHIKSTFDLWKGDQPQIDDVLFLGIQL
ncbi:MAG: SpoIIE family protein phosphatase, partial [Bacteroidales bacterium]|nr:SpoIIE family protein phosphatase [Bacteroidales bacterium]